MRSALCARLQSHLLWAGVRANLRNSMPLLFIWNALGEVGGALGVLHILSALSVSLNRDQRVRRSGDVDPVNSIY